MGTFAVARNSVQVRTDYVLNTGSLFYLPAVVGQLPPLHYHACGLSAESTYVNTIKEPTGSGNRLLSEKIVTQYNVGGTR